MVIVLFGQPNSGKSTLSSRLHCEMGGHQIDGDSFRTFFKNNDYSKKGRIENLKKACDIGYYLVNNNFSDVLIYSMIFPYKETRDYLSQLMPDALFFYLHYDLFRGRESNHVIDFDVPDYEEAVHINTDLNTIDECIEIIKKKIYERVE